jgi:hypothetical protein
VQLGVVAREHRMVLAAGVHEGREEQREHRHVANYENPDSPFARNPPGSIGRILRAPFGAVKSPLRRTPCGFVLRHRRRDGVAF